MLTVGAALPEFKLTAVKNRNPKEAFEEVSNANYAGNWLVLFFWPKDFTFVCPTEIVAFGQLNEEFKQRDAVVLGASTDSDFTHLAWRQQHEELRESPLVWLSDIKRELATALGILDVNAGVALRATFIVDPTGIIRHVSVNDLNVGRNPKEILRVLDALQTDELCPCNWQKGEETIHV